MIHPGSWRNPDLERFRGPMPECYKKLFMVIERTYARVVADHSNLSFHEVLAILMRDSTELGQEWYTAGEALAAGFCDKIEPYEYTKEGPPEHPPKDVAPF